MSKLEFLSPLLALFKVLITANSTFTGLKKKRYFIYSLNFLSRKAIKNECYFIKKVHILLKMSQSCR